MYNINMTNAKENINVSLESLLSAEELAVIQEMRANVQAKDTAVMDENANPVYEPLIAYESPENMEVAQTIKARVAELKKQNAPLYLLPEKINAFFRPNGNNIIPATEFCTLLQETGSIPSVCAILRKNFPTLHVSPAMIADYRALVPSFGDQVDFALDLFNAKLEEAAVERAVEGVDEPVYYQGIECGSKKKYSDDLLKFLMQANNPNKYGKADGKTNGSPIVVQIASFQQSSDYGGDNGLLTEVNTFEENQSGE